MKKPTAQARQPDTRMPWVWVRVVFASRIVSPIEKLVFSEQRGLSDGRGATKGAGPLGLRLGLSRDTIERARRTLVDFGLLAKLDLGPGRAAAWFPTLPEDCQPPTRCRRLVDDDVQALAELLDAHIATKSAQTGGSPAATQGLKVLRRSEDPAARLAAGEPPAPRRNSQTRGQLREAYDGARGVRGVRGTETNTKTVSREELKREADTDEREATS